MSVKINLHWYELQELADGKAIIEVSGNTTGQCLERLVEEFPTLRSEMFDKDGELLGYLTIFINGGPAFPRELSRPVKDGDEIHVVPLVAGG